MTPSFMGRIATILPGVRPTISLACLPTASISPLFVLTATMEGSFTTMPFPLTRTRVLAVPKSMARSDEKRLKTDPKFIDYSALNSRSWKFRQSVEDRRRSGSDRPGPNRWWRYQVLMEYIYKHWRLARQARALL